jgi:cohesin loading factor subunit SCC2
LEDRLSDGSPAVRDIAVDLVGKYIVQKPTLATEYYRHIADRIEVSPHLYDLADH